MEEFDHRAIRDVAVGGEVFSEAAKGVLYHRREKCSERIAFSRRLGAWSTACKSIHILFLLCARLNMFLRSWQPSHVS